MISALIAVALCSKARLVGLLTISGIVMHHIVGRYALGVFENPLLALASIDLLIAAAHLFFPYTIFGLWIALLFCAMTIFSTVALLFDFDITQGQGLAFDYWNLMSATLHVIAVLTFIGLWKQRNGRLSGYNTH